jgi:hypothetical protein
MWVACECSKTGFTFKIIFVLDQQKSGNPPTPCPCQSPGADGKLDSVEALVSDRDFVRSCSPCLGSSSPCPSSGDGDKAGADNSHLLKDMRRKIGRKL